MHADQGVGSQRDDGVDVINQLRDPSASLPRSEDPFSSDPNIAGIKSTIEQKLIEGPYSWQDAAHYLFLAVHSKCSLQDRVTAVTVGDKDAELSPGAQAHLIAGFTEELNDGRYLKASALKFGEFGGAINGTVEVADSKGNVLKAEVEGGAFSAWFNKQSAMDFDHTPIANASATALLKATLSYIKTVPKGLADQLISF